MLGTLLGNYRIVDQLGAGGMGVVYVGRHETLGHRVVVKVLMPDLSSNTDMVQRFFNEAQAATAIRSPGIVQVFDFGTTPFGCAYFVMELLDGQSLAARLKQRRHDHGECCRLGRQVANVLQAAHSAGITHRDLKPDNLFLVPDPEVVGGERVKVLDFGIAKLAGEARGSGVKTSTGLVMGTPHYMSPEQCRSASTADARSDIYSLGCILFEIACGRPPFVGVGLGDIVAAHLHDPPPRPQQLAPDLPARLSALIAKMLAKRPDARPQTMAAVSEALDDILRKLDRSSSRATARSPALAPPLARAPSPVPAPGPESPSARAPTPWPVPAPGPGSPSARAPTPWPEPAPGGPLAPVSPAAPVSSPMPLFARPVSVPPSRANQRRVYVALGGLVIAGAAAAVAFVLARAPAESMEHVISYGDIAAHAAPDTTAADIAPARSPQGVPAADDAPARSPQGAAAVSLPAAIAPRPPQSAPGAAVNPPVATAPRPSQSVPGAAVSPPAATAPRTPQSAPVVAAPPPSAPAMTAGPVETECRAYQAARRWPALELCADRLQPLDAARAAELKTRAIEEARSAPHASAVEAALRDRNLRRARAELDQVWPGAVDRANLQRACDRAESQEIDALATRLDGVKDASCDAYNRLLATQRAVDPPRVIAEATRRVRCVAQPRCDADALVAAGGQQFGAGQLARSLASYEAAYACRPAPALLQKAFVVACNLHDVARARSYWKRLPAPLRSSALGVCVRNGIDETGLNTP